MPNYRMILSTLILAIALVLVLVVLYRNSQSEEVQLKYSSSLDPASPYKIETNQNAQSLGDDSRDPSQPSGDERIIASTGDQVVLKVYADRSFQLHLPHTTEGIFVPVDKELFTSDSLPDGVKIKVRNSAGEIFTAEGGYGMQISYGPNDESWYRPGSNHIEMPVFSSRDPITGEAIIVPGSGEPIKPASTESSARSSPRGKLTDLIFGLSPRIRQQSGLEFKLAIFPSAIPNGRDSEGDYLSPLDFQLHETEWLDGHLLFDDE